MAFTARLGGGENRNPLLLCFCKIFDLLGIPLDPVLVWMIKALLLRLLFLLCALVSGGPGPRFLIEGGGPGAGRPSRVIYLLVLRLDGDGFPVSPDEAPLLDGLPIGFVIMKPMLPRLLLENVTLPDDSLF